MTDAPAINIAARLLERAARHPDRVAFVSWRGSRAERVTFEQLARRVAGFSSRLRGRGVTSGDRVLLFVPMSVELYVALLAIHHAGATAVFVDAWADRRRLEAAVDAARPRAFVGTLRAHLLRLVSPAVRAIPLSFVVRHGLGGGPRKPWVPEPESIPGAAPIPPSMAALVTFTTGSTGRPKAAARSHQFLWAQHQILAAHLGQRESDVDMPTLPVFVLNNLAGGITSVLPDVDPRRPAEIRPEVILGQIRAASVTTASGSPAFFERLCEHVLGSDGTLPLQAFFTGGAPVPPELARTFARCCAGAQVLYGSTEAEPIAALTAQELVQRTDAGGGIGLCAGTPIREIELSEWRQTGGEPGEIVVTGPHVLAGYLDNPEADRENKVRDGERVWHRTGDGGFLDDQGRLWLTGRVKHRVRRAGETWWGLPVELRALSVPAIAHAAYLGLPDPRLGQRAVLCVEIPPAAMGPATERELVAAAAPAPVDQVIALERIPRDPRHASKTDMEALIARIERR